MRITFWGTRGSIAKPGPDTARYGGNTSCVEVRSESGTLIVIDCGTGGHGLGQVLINEKRPPGRSHLLISHTHWDHIQGIPFFAPLFAPGHDWDIYGPKGLSQGLRTTLAGQMEHTYFPIPLESFGATIRYHDLVEGSFSVSDVKVTTRYLNHPALALGYRIEADGASVAYCCDHEPYSVALASGESALTGVDKRHADFLQDADLVLHDAQYTAAEYGAKVGWGHSPVEYAVRVCREASVKTLFLTHHDPLRRDEAIDQIVEGVRRRLLEEGSPLEVRAAAEGLSLSVKANPDRPAQGAKGGFEARTAIDALAVKRPVVLYVNDPKLNAILSEAIAIEGLPRVVVTNERELRQAVDGTQISLVLAEHTPPGIDGHATFVAVREGQRASAIQAPVVLVSAHTSAAEREKSQATDWLTSPFTLSYARTKIRSWALRSACRWVRAPMPEDEDQRLLDLRDLAILDTPPEQRFDRLTRLAAAALEVPIALVSLVDADRQWFKSCFGLQEREMPRDLAFCAHAVQNKADLIVPDTLLDDRFADNPLVTGAPRIRFYAGAALMLDDGNCLGTLCVIDTRPRNLSASDLALLRDLRDLALKELQSGQA